MLLENFQVGRIMLHEVFRRASDKQMPPPRYGTHLISLTPEAIDVFRSRVTDALGSSSQCMEMTIRDQDAGSVVAVANGLVGTDDATFIARSRGFADKLAVAQTSRQWPGGIVIAFDGTVGSQSIPVVGVLKAETHSGFSRDIKVGEMSVSFFQNLFLSPQTKLYKIGMFLRRDAAETDLAMAWRAIVYDSNMSAANRQGAAQYFYESFLGCTFPINSALLTKQFFDSTRDFIRGLDIEPEKKSDLLTGLYTYLKVDTSPTIQVSGFAENYFTTDVRDHYTAYMVQLKFPDTAVSKDLTDIASSLRQRKISFGGSLKLTGSPEDFNQLVAIERVSAGPDNAPVDWTRITIKDRVRQQE